MHAHAGQLLRGPRALDPYAIYVCCDLLLMNKYYTLLVGAIMLLRRPN